MSEQITRLDLEASLPLNYLVGGAKGWPEQCLGNLKAKKHELLQIVEAAASDTVILHQFICSVASGGGRTGIVGRGRLAMRKCRLEAGPHWQGPEPVLPGTFWLEA